MSPSLGRVLSSALLLIGLWTGSLFLPGLAWAETEVEPGPRRLVLAEDLRVFLGEEQDTQALEYEHLQEAMRKGARSLWRTSPLELEVLPDQSLSVNIQGASLYEGTLALARQWGEMGVEAYRQVKTQAAAEHLERALQNFSTISHDLLAPQEVAQVLLYLSLAYLEDGTNVVRPLETLQEMIRRDPGLIMEPGYYPDFIVQYYRSARDTLWRELRQEGPPPEESQRLAELVGADYVFHGYVVPVDQGFELIAYLYDEQERAFLPGERLFVSALDPETLEEGFSRLASRLAACLVEPIAPVQDPGVSTSRGTSRLSLRLNLAYGSFLQLPSPLRSPFGNYGAGIGAYWAITREFQVVADAQIFHSIRDYDGILRDDFTTLRLMAGLELGQRFGPIYLGFIAGVEAAAFGPIRAFSDPSCIPAPDFLCPGDRGTVTFEAQGMHWGLRLSPQIALPLAASFEVISSMTASYYFSPLSSRLFNFPMTTELGIRYRF